MSAPYILVWCTYREDGEDVDDHWVVYEDETKARSAYKELLEQEEDLHSASLCRPIESTDYDVIPP